MGSDTVSPLPALGSTLLSGAGRTLAATGKNPEGAEKEFLDIGPRTYGTNTQRSNRVKKCILVRNVSGTTLYARQMATWKSGKTGLQVDGLVTTTYARAAGVIDEHLPSAGCPNNDLCWITVKGPTEVLVDQAGGANNVFSMDQPIVALTAATSQATTAGRVMPFGATSNATYIGTAVLNKIGRAMSARTTAQTTQGLLADIDVWT